jgi:hypothetical protein
MVERPFFTRCNLANHAIPSSPAARLSLLQTPNPLVPKHQRITRLVSHIFTGCQIPCRLLPVHKLVHQLMNCELVLPNPVYGLAHQFIKWLDSVCEYGITSTYFLLR